MGKGWREKYTGIKFVYVDVSGERKRGGDEVETVGDLRRYIAIAVMMAKRTHLFPFRTQKLSSFTPKVLVGYYREDR